MKTKDILYIGTTAVLLYLIFKKTKPCDCSSGDVGDGGDANSTTNIAYILDQPKHMDLPNLTAGTGVSTEDSVKDIVVPKAMSNCGNSFTSGSNNYVFIDGKYYRQQQFKDAFLPRVEVSKEEFISACKRITPAIVNVVRTHIDPIVKPIKAHLQEGSLPHSAVQQVNHSVSNFRGTLHRGIM